MSKICRRLFSTEPVVTMPLPKAPMPYRSLRIATGEVVAAPIGSSANYPGEWIIKYGKDAVIPADDTSSATEQKFERARLAYLAMRDSFVQQCSGYWLGADETGTSFIIGESEYQVRKVLNVLLQTQGRNDAIYINCLGREVLANIQINDFGDFHDFGHVGEEHDINDFGGSFWQNIDNLACKYQNGVLWLNAEVAGASKEYSEVTMMHDSGSPACTAPKEVFDVETRLGDRMATQQITVALNKVRSTRVMDNMFVKVGGLVTKTRFYEHNKFLLGGDVWKRYETVINVSRNPPITMTPLDGEEDHE